MVPPDWARSTVVDLRAELKRRGLPQVGKKADLVARLTNADNALVEMEKDTVEAAKDEVVDHLSGSPSDKGPAISTNPAGDNYIKAATADATPSQGQSPPPGPPASDQQSPTSKSGKPEPTLVPHAEPFLPKAETEAGRPEPEVVDETPDRVANAPDQIVDKISEPKPDSQTNPDLLPVSIAQTLAKAPTTPSDAHQNSEAADQKNSAAPAPEAFKPTVSEMVADTASRKRRSRSPPATEDEAVRKRVRADSSDRAGALTKTRDLNRTSPQLANGNASPQEKLPLGDGGVGGAESYASLDSTANNFPRDMDFARDVGHSQHAATSALYIRDLMRPLKDGVLRDHLIDIATPPGAGADPSIVVDFYLDQIRTHAFVEFCSVQVASRVRAALHGTVWPNERNRKALWVDFIPPGKVREWADLERSEGSGGRGNGARWEVWYEGGQDGASAVARLVNPADEPGAPGRGQGRVIKGPRSGTSAANNESSNPALIPTGPAPHNPSFSAAGHGDDDIFDQPPPRGPRGDRDGHYGDARPQSRFSPGAGGGAGGGGKVFRWTQARPPLRWRPVSEPAAAGRLHNMRAFYTRDADRDMGPRDEINRYTFENFSDFVDRGKEHFVGIRPPWSERERRRAGGGGGGRPPMVDRYHPGSDRDGGRSRLDGAPLPMYGGKRRKRGGRHHRRVRR